MAVTLRRGFKAEADAYAREFRIELKLAAHHPLNMFSLAEHLAIPVLPLSHFAGDLKAKQYELLTQSVKSPMSAVTISLGSRGRRRCIVFNDAHAPQRQQSDMAHELAHAILDHPASELTNESGGRHFNKELEDEAAWMSGVLLIPKEAAISILSRRRPVDNVVTEYNVSEVMIRMRLYQSGAMKIMKRTTWSD